MKILKPFKIKIFWLSSTITFLIYSFISNQLYGKLVLNPQEVYGTNISAQDVYESQSNILELFISLLNTFSIILFSPEFEFWVSPILLIGLISIFLRGKLFSISNFLIFLCFAQNFLLFICGRHLDHLTVLDTYFH